MAHNSKPQGRRDKKTDVSVPAATDFVTWKLTRLGLTGKITRIVVRAPASSNWTAGELKVFQGSGYDTDTEIDDVPDEDVIVELTGMTISGHATDADEDENIALAKESAVFDVRASDEDLWCGIKATTGTAQTNVVVSVEAEDCS